MISPGTAFSQALAERLDAWAAKRLAKSRGFRRVVLSDASVAGEGELKAFEYADTYGDRDVVVYGGDADLVAMALSRCQRRGRLRILDENGRLIDVKNLAKRVAPAHPLDLAVLACVEINQCVGCTDNSSLSHFSAMAWPSWLGRAVRYQHHHATEQASRRWRGGRRDDSARTRRKI